MNQNTRSSGVTVAVVLLGVAAGGAAAFGLSAPVLALGAADLLEGPLGSAALAATTIVGVVSLLFAATAGMAARMVHAGRTAGLVIGFVLGAILIAGPSVAAASGGWHPALAVSVVLGAGIIGSLAITLPTAGVPRL
jgi:hypothetical protein